MTTGYQQFSTADAQPHERFDHWRTWYLEAAGPVHLEPYDAVPRDFAASASVLTVGGVSIVEVLSGPARSSWARVATESPETVAIGILSAAPGVTGHWHGHDLASDRAVLRGRTAGEWCAPAGLRMIQVNVPRAMMTIPDAVIDRVAARQLVSRSSVFTSLIRPALAGMAGRLPELAGTATAGLATTWLSLATLLLRSLDGDHADDVERAPVRRLTAARFIEAHLADPRLDPEMVARHLAISRRSLYDLFAAEGDGVAAVIRRQRLVRARELLLDPDQRHHSIADIAAAVGMPRAAQFSRAFRAEYGQSPREARGTADRTPHGGPETATAHSVDRQRAATRRT